MNPEVSIIMPAFNSEKYIQESIESVINQSFKNWELIIVDDASTDNSLKSINPYLKKYNNIHLIINSSNQGIAISRNKATKQAKGKYIAFLDSDDLWKPNKLKIQLKFLKTNKADICFSSYELLDENGEQLNKTVKALKVLSYKKLLKSNYVGNLTGIYNCEILKKIYTPNLKKRQDWLLWLKAFKRANKPVKSIQESLAYYRVRKQSISANKLKLLKYNYLVFKKGLEYSTVKSSIYFIWFLFEQFFVKSKQTISTKDEK